MPVYRVHQTGSPYNASELADIDYEQTADVLYMAHPSHAPTKLLRLDHASWSFVTIAFGPTIAAPANLSAVATNPNTDAANGGNAYFPQEATYVVTAYSDETGQESRASNADSATNDIALKRNFNTITWDAVTGATEYRVYKAEESQRYGAIGSTEALSFVDDNIGPDLSEGPPTGDNPFADADDYPATVTFHEQRSAWARSNNNPNGLWCSKSADYENFDFSKPGREDDAFAIRLVANKVNSVNQLVSSKQGLLALTSNNIFSITGANGDYLAAVPPPRVRPEVSRGVSRLNPITVDNVVFYETAKSSEVRTLGYTLELDGIRTDDLTVFSRHLFENQDIVDWAFAEKPGSIIPLVRSDGAIVCLTWDQAQEVAGWTYWDTPHGAFEGICSITEQGEDRPYLLVRRTINGEEKLYIERMASPLWEDQEDACYLDCARSFVNAAPVATVDRLDHLEGMDVVAWVDGNVVTGLTVEDGSVTLPNAGTKITVGLPFTSLVETLPLAIQTGGGWNVARPQQAGKVVLRVVDTRNIEAGPADDQLFPVKTRETEGYGSPNALITDDLEVDMAGTSGNETVVVVRSTDPTPMHIAAILIEPVISAG